MNIDIKKHFNIIITLFILSVLLNGGLSVMLISNAQIDKLRDEDLKKLETIEEEIVEEVKIIKEEKKEFPWEKYGRSDPFDPDCKYGTYYRHNYDDGVIRLEGIMRFNGQFMVIFNNQILTVEDSIKGNKIVDIKKNYVVLKRDNNKIFEIRI